MSGFEVEGGSSFCRIENVFSESSDSAKKRGPGEKIEGRIRSLESEDAGTTLSLKGNPKKARKEVVKEVTTFRTTNEDDKIYVVRVAGEAEKERKLEMRRGRKRLRSALRRALESPAEREARLAKQRLANLRMRTQRSLEKLETAEQRAARLATRQALLDAGHPETRVLKAEQELARRARQRLPSPERRERYLARKREDSRRFRQRERDRRWGRAGAEAPRRKRQEDKEEDKPIEEGTSVEDKPSIAEGMTEEDSTPQSNEGEKLVFFVPLKQYISLSGKTVPVVGGDPFPENPVFPVGISPSLAVLPPSEDVEIVPDLPGTQEFPSLNQRVKVKTEPVDSPDSSEDNHPSPSVNNPIVEVKTEPGDTPSTPETQQWPEITFDGSRIKTEPMDSY